MDGGMSLSGLATGMNTDDIINQLMAIERRPVTLMANNQAQAQSKLDRLRALNLKVSALQTASKALASSSFTTSTFANKAATSSNAAILGATADANAGTGSYSVEVLQLAREQRTGGGAFTSPATAGTLRITKDDGTFKQINVAAGSSINQVKDSINAGNMGMSASVVNGALVLTSADTGHAYTIDDGDTDGDGTADGTSAFAAGLGIDTATAGRTYQTAQMAQVKVDGTFTVSSASNQITNAIGGVTINAVTTGTANVTVSRDNSAVSGKVRDFVNKYNDIITQIKEDTKYNAETKKGGKLLGDSFVSNLTVQLNRFVTDEVQLKDPNTGTYGTDPDFRSYSSVGISVNRDGTLALDETKLNAAIAKSPEKTFALFAQEDNVTTTDPSGQIVKSNTNRDGIAHRLAAFADGLISKNSSYNWSNGTGGRYEGGLLAKITSEERNVRSYDDRMDAYDRRLELRERSIRNQFIAMEKSVAMLRNQGNYLAGQLGQKSG
jgi:flagellar hook-associated protein 2